MTPKLPESVWGSLKTMVQRLAAPVAVDNAASQSRKVSDGDKDRQPANDHFHFSGWPMYGHC